MHFWGHLGNSPNSPLSLRHWIYISAFTMKMLTFLCWYKTCFGGFWVVKPGLMAFLGRWIRIWHLFCLFWHAYQDYPIINYEYDIVHFYIFQKCDSWHNAYTIMLMCLFDKMNDSFELCDPQNPQKHVLKSKNNVLYQHEKVNISMVKVDISWYRCLISRA